MHTHIDTLASRCICIIALKYVQLGTEALRGSQSQSVTTEILSCFEEITKNPFEPMTL